jgi:pyruvate/2-oxoglutarate dehydrogenase complex dihydrolipoamide dehydrogenase (E3) component
MNNEFEYDIIVIGLGPAGMAASAMAPSMGLTVLAIEDHKVGGECLNYGCTPSKALLKSAEVNYIANNTEKYGIKLEGKTIVENPLKVVREKIAEINATKTMKMFDKNMVTFILNEGKAKFVDKHTVSVGNKQYTGKSIFIATGTKPFIPPIPGIFDVEILTNLNMFEQKEIPESLTIIGGGAIGTEMAQAFSRLGTKVTIVQMNSYLIPIGDEEAGILLEQKFIEEGIKVYNSTSIEKVVKEGDMIVVKTNKGNFVSEKLLVAAGREVVIESLELDNIGIETTKKGIKVDEYMRTNVDNVYAIGDCNGIAQLSHAAMHQGMLALMNSISPRPIKRLERSNYAVPWSVFTKPEMAQVGLTEKQAKDKEIEYTISRTEYSDYGRTLTDGETDGFIKVISDKNGIVLGATIIGHVASELIQEWTMAVQNKLSLFNIAMTQHSFPTLSVMNKRVAENWMMDLAKSGAMNEMMGSLMA